MNRIYERTCKICHKEFETENARRQCCSDECKRQNNILNSRKNYSRIKNIRRVIKSQKKVNTKLTVTDIAVKAKEAGMSYGQYVASMNIH